MNDKGLTPAIREQQFIADVPEFPLEFPASNPFFWGTAITFRQQDKGFGLDIKYRNVTTPPGRLATNIAGDILERRRRDLERFPDSARARLNLAAALIAQAQPEEAAVHLSTVLQSEPDNCVALGSMARVRLLQGQLEEAESLYQRLRQLNPDDVSSLIGLAHIAVHEQAFEQGVSFLQEAAESLPEKPLTRLHLAVLLLRLNRSREAIKHLRIASQNAVRWPSLHEALGVAYVFNGDLHKAERSFRAALALSPDDSRTLCALGEVLYRLQNYESAANVLSRAIVKNPANAKPREILARVFEQEREYKRARQQLIDAEASLNDEHTDQLSRIQNNIGVCTSLLDQTKAAHRWFTRSIETAPIWSPIPYLNAARLNIELGDLSAAITALESCRSRFPDTKPQVVTLLGLCLSRQGNFVQAARELQSVVEVGTGTPATYSLLGAILEDNIRDHRRAIQVLVEGNKKYPADPLIGNNLAYTWLEDGRPHEARRLLESMKPSQDTGGSLEVTLRATWGLLKLWEGDLTGGETDYRTAETMARQRQDGALADRVRQKMHLEIARFYERQGDYSTALDQANNGLKFSRPTSYREDLEIFKTRIETILLVKRAEALRK